MTVKEGDRAVLVVSTTELQGSYWMRITTFVLAAVMTAALIGCKGGDTPKVESNNTEAKLPVFSLATSEYPSWSTFVVAAKAGLINPREGGEPGSLEKKWGVDIVLHVKDYDPCLTMYGGGTVDACCMTNMDALNPSLTRATTAIIPTSTSAGGDKVIAVGVEDLKGLKGQKVYGLAKSVSEYTYVRCLQVKELDPKDYPFVNLEPSAAATAIQTGSNDVKAVCIWNPFALQTLRTQKSAKVVCDSSMIPEEIIDMVVVSNDALKRDKGEEFACCVCDIFYEVNKKMADPKTSEVTYKALGAEFSNLNADDMKTCCKDTRFYANNDAGTTLFTSPKFQKTTMAQVVKTCQQIGVLEGGKAPKIGFGDPSAQLNFDTKYMTRAATGK